MGNEIYRNNGDNVKKKFLAIVRHEKGGDLEYGITVKDETIYIPSGEMRKIVSKLAVFFIEQR